MMRPVSKALLASIWFMLLTFPVMGIKLNTVEQTVEWQFDRILLLGVAIFFLSLLWNWCFSRKGRGLPLIALPSGMGARLGRLCSLPLRDGRSRAVSLTVLLLVMLIMPLASSFYQTNIMILAMLYVMLALGLNIAVGIAGQLVLGYVAFYAVGAYAYALLNQFFGLGFWACLPVGGLLAVLFGLALGFPVLRLRGEKGQFDVVLQTLEDSLAALEAEKETLGGRAAEAAAGMEEKAQEKLLRQAALHRGQHHLHLLPRPSGGHPDHRGHHPPEEFPCGPCPAGPARG